MRFTPALWTCSVLHFAFGAVGAALFAASPAPTVQLDAAAARVSAQAIEEAVPVSVADGLEAKVWATEELLIDPVGIDVDDQGRAWVSVTRRRRSSMFDIRRFPEWVAESWSWTDVEQRRAFLRRELAPERSEENDWLRDFNEDGSRDWRDLRVEADEIYELSDADGDGRADTARRHDWLPMDELSDIAGTVLSHGGDVFVGLPPDVWRMQDLDGDGEYETRTSVSHGYGIHIGFGGHGLSGLKVGPDGRIYWGIGDVGFSGEDQEGRLWSYPGQGIIARSEVDGSGFEVVAHGLRNVHEFDWDAYGNLIGVDNDGDHAGEDERLVYLIHGSDTGWRNNWQLGKYTDPKNNAYKVWMDEGYSLPRFEGQAAHILPALASYHTGPAGLVYQPGTALGGRWKDHFLVASFTGNAANSAVYAFSLEPSGASFTWANDEKLMSGVTGVGIDFSPEGDLFIADWAEGWDTDGVGRIWKLGTPGPERRSAEATAALLRAGFSDRGASELVDLLGHVDRRVRLGAQFELAEREAVAELKEAAQPGRDLLARVHAIWGLGQLARKGVIDGSVFLPLASDGALEARAQVARQWGDIGYEPAAATLRAWVAEGEPRIQLLATEALGRIGDAAAFDTIVAMLERNADKEVYLRHAGAIALARIADGDQLSALADHESEAVRVAAVVALKRLEHAGASRFLEDESRFVRTNAARAISDDAFIEAGLPALAEMLLEESDETEALRRRAINANLYVGGAASAERLARFAQREAALPALRVDALDTLAFWSDPSVYDRVTGVVRERPRNEIHAARTAMERAYTELLSDDATEVRVATVRALGQLRIESAETSLLALVRTGATADEREAALQALRTMESVHLVAAIESALQDESGRLRSLALGLTPELSVSAEAKEALLIEAWDQVGVEQRKAILPALVELRGEASVAFLSRLLADAENERIEPELLLELAEAIEAAEDAGLQQRLRRFRDLLATRGTAAEYSFALWGGDVESGREVVYEVAAAQCIRCHAIDGQGGDVGPDLAGVGERLDRVSLLLSLVEPSAEIAQGYGVASVSTTSGASVQGVVVEETATELVIRRSDGELEHLEKRAIERRVNAPSSMPPMGLLLDQRQIRDVVAFLASLRGEEAAPADALGHGGD